MCMQPGAPRPPARGACNESHGLYSFYTGTSAVYVTTAPISQASIPSSINFVRHPQNGTIAVR